MVNITQSTQLTVFDLIRAAIRIDSTLAIKFQPNKFHLFEPNYKSVDFTSFPYIVISPPNLDSEHITLDNSLNDKELVINVQLVMDYMAKDNFIDYCNKIITAVNGYYTTFSASGYYNVQCDLNDSDQEYRKHKHVIVGFLTVRFGGAV